MAGNEANSISANNENYGSDRSGKVKVNFTDLAGNLEPFLMENSLTIEGNNCVFSAWRSHDEKINKTLEKLGFRQQKAQNIAESEVKEKHVRFESKPEIIFYTLPLNSISYAEKDLTKKPTILNAKHSRSPGLSSKRKLECASGITASTLILATIAKGISAILGFTTLSLAVLNPATALFIGLAFATLMVPLSAYLLSKHSYFDQTKNEEKDNSTKFKDAAIISTCALTAAGLSYTSVMASGIVSTALILTNPAIIAGIALLAALAIVPVALYIASRNTASEEQTKGLHQENEVNKRNAELSNNQIQPK